MDAVKELYDSQVSEDDVVAPADEREAPLAIEDIVPPVDEPESPANHGSRSRSRTPRMREPPIPTADNLPPLPPKPNRKPGRSRVPRGTPPRKNLGWDITRTAKAIHRCQLPGDWYQGGQNDRIVYTNDEQTYYIHQQSRSMWVQGREDHIINARLATSSSEAWRPQVAPRAR